MKFMKKRATLSSYSPKKVHEAFFGKKKKKTSAFSLGKKQSS